MIVMQLSSWFWFDSTISVSCYSLTSFAHPRSPRLVVIVGWLSFKILKTGGVRVSADRLNKLLQSSVSAGQNDNYVAAGWSPLRTRIPMC